MKQRIPTVLGAALVAAGCLSGATAWADDTTPSTPSMMQGSDYGNPADKHKVVPSREQVQENAASPSSSTLDDNAQRQHDRDQGADRPAGADNAATDNAESQPTPHPGMSAESTGNAADQAESNGTPATRSWDRIDANHDNSVSPDEMDQWLQQHRSGSPRQGPQDSGSSDSGTRPQPTQQQ